MLIKIKNLSNNPDPSYATEGSAGFDLAASLTETVTLKPLSRVLIPTGLYFEIPPGKEMQVRPRSGHAFKHGITVLNSPGTIDSDYRGEVGVILINLGDTEFTINSGDRIAQGVITDFIQAQFVRDELNETVRGKGGFGSTNL